MSAKEFSGSLWSAEANLGSRIFEEKTGDFTYAYNRNRKFSEGHILVFYNNYELLGMVPVISPSGIVGPQGPYRPKPDWTRNWTKAMELDFSEKRIFSPPLSVRELTNVLHFLNGKTGRTLHDICRNSPNITYEEYLYLLSRSNRPADAPQSADYSTFKISKKPPAESMDLLGDLSTAAVNDSLPAERLKKIYFTYKRNQRLIKKLKNEYNGVCQICGISNQIITDNGGFYTEGHHIIPLGQRGSDNLRNVVILCPLCHRKLHYSRDRGALKQRITYSPAHERILRAFR